MDRHDDRDGAIEDRQDRTLRAARLTQYPLEGRQTLHFLDITARAEAFALRVDQHCTRIGVFSDATERRRQIMQESDPERIDGWRVDLDVDHAAGKTGHMKHRIHPC